LLSDEKTPSSTAASIPNAFQALANKSASNTYECSVCEVRNPLDSAACAACSEPNPNKSVTNQSTAHNINSSGFTFGSANNTSSNDSSAAAPIQYSFGSNGGFNFGASQQ
jgi:hypothetical protein